MDLGSYSLPEYHDCLHLLGKIGERLGCHKQMLKQIELSLPSCGGRSSILDVGCGGGDFAALLARRFPHAQVVGCDLDQEAVRFAAERHKAIPNLSFSNQALEGFSSNQFDVVTATLVCHHLSDSELPSFIQQLSRVAKQAVVLNDLKRSRIAFFLYLVTAPILFRNRLIFHDGLLSIRRSFIRKDWERLLPGKKKYNISQHWPFRYIVKIWTSS